VREILSMNKSYIKKYSHIHYFKILSQRYLTSFFVFYEMLMTHWCWISQCFLIK